MRTVVVLVSAVALAVLSVSFVRGHTRAHPKPAPAPVRHAVHRPTPTARPPQFVISSFDGSGGARLWAYWRTVAQRAHAHFSFFLSGVYFVDWAHHDRYVPPVGNPGDSAIGFAPDEAWIAAMRKQIALGYAEGNEIGTHYNGHFCGPTGVGTWSAKDWDAELKEFDRLVFTKDAHLGFGPQAVVGGRTPCLEGDLAALYPVLKENGYRYDASRTALLGTWPSKIDGIWSFPLLEVPFVGHTFRVVAMDYNLMANQIADDESAARIENEAYRTLWNAFVASYRGSRAPLSLGNHFETWESWAYDHALTRFLLRACALPEVRCASFKELADWLDGLPARTLARYRAGRFARAPKAFLNRT